MRTTVTIDDDLLVAARNLAQAKGESLGKAISSLIRRGLVAQNRTASQNGFPVFTVPPDAEPITLEHVKRLEDEP